MATIGFIGLGRMGLPMARNLLKAGHAVRAFDVIAGALDAAVGAGAVGAPSAADVADDVETVVTMLPAGRDTLDVYERSGVLGRARKGTLFIDCSTIDVASAKRTHALAAEAGMPSLDAPVSGGIAGAEAATLTFMVGGEASAYEAGLSALEAMGARFVHCGEAGAGQIAKMCNQMMVAINMAGVAEAFVLAQKLGLSPKALFDVVSTSSGGSWALSHYVPVPGLVATSAAERGFKPGFTTNLMLKDLKIFQEAAREAGTATPVGAVTTALYNHRAHSRPSETLALLSLGSFQSIAFPAGTRRALRGFVRCEMRHQAPAVARLSCQTRQTRRSKRFTLPTRPKAAWGRPISFRASAFPCACGSTSLSFLKPIRSATMRPSAM